MTNVKSAVSTSEPRQDYLLTEDRHFRPLADAGYRTRPISPQEFTVRFVEAPRS